MAPAPLRTESTNPGHEPSSTTSTDTEAYPDTSCGASPLAPTGTASTVRPISRILAANRPARRPSTTGSANVATSRSPGSILWKLPCTALNESTSIPRFSGLTCTSVRTEAPTFSTSTQK